MFLREKSIKQAEIDDQLNALKAITGIMHNKLPCGWTSPLNNTFEKKGKNHVVEMPEIKAHTGFIL